MVPELSQWLQTVISTLIRSTLTTHHLQMMLLKLVVLRCGAPYYIYSKLTTCNQQQQDCEGVLACEFYQITTGSQQCRRLVFTV